MFLCSLNNPSGTSSFIGDVVTMEEVLNRSNEILSSDAFIGLKQNGLNQDGSLHHHFCVR
jgi:hypothetical protein